MFLFPYGKRDKSRSLIISLNFSLPRFIRLSINKLKIKNISSIN